MIVEVDINVRCPSCGLVMLRDSDHVVCILKECGNYGVKYELPKLILRQKYESQPLVAVPNEQPERTNVMVNEAEEVLHKMQEALEALRKIKPEDRSEQARRIQVTITEYEKMIAYYMTYVLGMGLEL
jgi:hypothetical protein